MPGEAQQRQGIAMRGNAKAMNRCALKGEAEQGKAKAERLSAKRGKAVRCTARARSGMA